TTKPPGTLARDVLRPSAARDPAAGPAGRRLSPAIWIQHVLVRILALAPAFQRCNTALVAGHMIRSLITPLRVALPFVATAVAALGRSLMTPVVAEESPLLFFVPAVLVSAQLGGLWSGLACTALSAIVVGSLMLAPAGTILVDEAADVAT